MATRLPRSRRKPRSSSRSRSILAEPHFVGRDPPGCGDQAHDRTPGGRFARSGFADDAQPLAAQREATRCARRPRRPHRRDRPRAGCARSAAALAHAERESATSRRPSPSRLKPDAGHEDRRCPGSVATHHWSSSTCRPDGNHRAPFRRRRLRAEPEKAQPRRGQDDARHVQRQADDHRRQAQRHDLGER